MEANTVHNKMNLIINLPGSLLISALVMFSFYRLIYTEELIGINTITDAPLVLSSG